MKNTMSSIFFLFFFLVQFDAQLFISIVNMFQFHFYEVLFINLNFICHNLTFMAWSEVSFFFIWIEMFDKTNIATEKRHTHREKESVVFFSCVNRDYIFMTLMLVMK